MEGKRIAPWIYTGLSFILATGIGLLFLQPPAGTLNTTLTVAKVIAFLVMAGNTAYGTLYTWPALQFSVGSEAKGLWKGYVFRAYVTFACGVTAIVIAAFQRSL